jgi:hypothetical protein
MEILHFAADKNGFFDPVDYRSMIFYIVDLLGPRINAGRFFYESLELGELIFTSVRRRRSIRDD